MYFQSRRPPTGSKQPRKNFALWVVKRNPAGGWSEPQDLDLPAESSNGEWNPCVTNNGTLYFNGTYAGAEGIYRSRMVKGRYLAPENPGPSINTDIAFEVEPCLPPDESFMVYYSAGGPGNLTKGGKIGDLYISFKNKEDLWSKGKNIGEPVNSTAEENWPRLSPDGKYLFFCSNRGRKNRLPDIYWVDAGIIGKLKPE